MSPTENHKPEPVARMSAEIVADQLERLREIFPECFAEGRVDFDKLKAALGEEIDSRPERYSFSWAGKRDAIRLLQMPSRATLVPCPKDSVNFETAENIFIEGENLEVLKLLYKSYFGRVKMIYIDPPYNTGKDFIYPDNFTDPLDTYLRITGQKDNGGNLLTTNPETSGRYHSTWLSMMYPRLFLGRQLLRSDGFLVVSIDDAEFYNLRMVLNEVFGEENFVATLVWDRNRKNDAKFFSVGHEYMLVYAQNKQFLRERDTVLRATKEGLEDVRSEFDRLRKEQNDNWVLVLRGLRKFFSEMSEDDPRFVLGRFNKVDGRGPYRDDADISWPGGGGPAYDVPHPITKKPCKLPRRGWVYPTKGRMDEEIAKGNVVFGEDETTVPSLKSYLFEKAEQVMRSVQFSYAQKAAQEFDAIFGGTRVFDNPKNPTDLRRLLEYLTEDGALVMDFFAGSCSFAQAVLDSNSELGQNRQFICVQLPEQIDGTTNTGKNALKLGLRTVADIGKERMRRVIKRIGTSENVGFKVFGLTESNYRPWTGVDEKDAEAYGKTMKLYSDPLVAGWKPESVICEVVVKEGFSLNSRVEKLSEIKSNTVYRVSDPERGQSFRICLDDSLKPETIEALNLQQGDLFVCRDKALDDEGAANLALQCRLKTI